MVNPTIYVSFIKQFWATTSIKKVNYVVKLQVLTDRKNVVVTEDIIRQDIRLDDADGVECLHTEEIFVELTRMGYEKPPPKINILQDVFLYQIEVFNPHTCSISQPAPPLSPPQEQPTTTSASDMTLLNTLMETCTTLSHKVAALEQDKVAQALKTFKLKRKVKKLEKKRRSKHSGLKRLSTKASPGRSPNEAAMECRMFKDLMFGGNRNWILE
nr:hypothetical protein [Tanacetum cinerariifolium]